MRPPAAAACWRRCWLRVARTMNSSIATYSHPREEFPIPPSARLLLSCSRHLRERRPARMQRTRRAHGGAIGLRLCARLRPLFRNPRRRVRASSTVCAALRPSTPKPCAPASLALTYTRLIALRARRWRRVSRGPMIDNPTTAAAQSADLISTCSRPLRVRRPCRHRQAGLSQPLVRPSTGRLRCRCCRNDGVRLYVPGSHDPQQ